MARERTLTEIAHDVVALARRKGAQDAAVRAYREREVSVEWRDGKVQKVQEATTRGVSVQLFVDGRFAAVSTRDLRPQGLDAFLADSVAMTRALAPDPFRALPEPALYAGQAKLDLEIDDPAQQALAAERRREMAQAIEAAAREVPGADAILSVTGAVSDTRSEAVRVHSNGFEGAHAETAFSSSVQVSVKDPDGRRPEDYAYASVRRLQDLPALAETGADGARRALRRVGARKGESGAATLVLDNRAAGRLVGFLAAPLSGASLQQRRSFLEGKLGAPVGSPLFTLADEPLLPRGLGSRLFDAEGISAKRLPVFDKGVLRNYYVDTYYGRKLKLDPTTGGRSNLSWGLGTRSKEQLVADAKDGFFVTSFLGGNSNGTTGDFSLGVSGFRIRSGQPAEPVSEMNIAGNHLELWRRLVAVGDDPFPYSPMRTPTLVFEGVQFAGL